MHPLLEIENLTAGYGDHQVLNGLSLTIMEGENIGLFGPNGHGKTTLFETISGLIVPRTGRIRFAGQDITGQTPQKIVEAGLIHVAQGNLLFADLSVGEVLALAAYPRRARPDKSRNLDKIAMLFPKLRQRSDQKCGTLSGGERQMLNLAVGLMASPRLLILDEPTLGLSPRLKMELAAAIAQIAEDGTPLLLVEQDIDFLLKLAARLFLVSHGTITRIINTNSANFNHADVMRDYFGIVSACENRQD